MSNRVAGEDGAERVFQSVASLLGHKVSFTFGCRSLLSVSPEQSLWLGSQSNLEVGSSSTQTHPNRFLPTCDAAPTSSCRPHELQSYLAHLKDILHSYHIERKTEETHTESAVRGSDRGEDVPATTLDTTVGDEDRSPKEVKENGFKLKSLSSVCVRGEMAAETREESQKLTSSTFGEEEGYCQTIWAKGVEETSAVGAKGEERVGGLAGPADGAAAVDELIDSLSTLFTAPASFDSEKSSCLLRLEFGGVGCESFESSSSQPGSQESSLPTCDAAPTSSCGPHELQSYLAHLREVLHCYNIKRKTEETHTESAVRGSDRGEDVPTATLDTTVGDEGGLTLERLPAVGLPVLTPERDEEMESLRQALKESEEKCLTLLEERGSVEKTCAESEEKLANLRTEVQLLEEKNTSLEEEGSRLRKERDDLTGKLSTMERESEEKCLQLLEEKHSTEKKWAEMEGQLARLKTERSARKEEVQRLIEKNTSLEEEGSRLRKERDDLTGRLSTMERELKEKCLQLHKEKCSTEKKWAEMEGQLARLKTERSAREEKVQKLTEKNTSLEEEGSRLRKERDDLARRLSTMKREEKVRGEQLQQVMNRNASLEEDNSRLRRERSDLAARLSAVEREVQKLTEKNTSLEKDRSSLKRKVDDQSRSLSTMESERDILEKDFCALKREKSNELYYVNQKLTAEKESNRVLLQRISSMDERLAKHL